MQRSIRISIAAFVHHTPERAWWRTFYALFSRSRDSDEFMGLQAESPLWVRLAIPYGGLGILRLLRAVHRLQKEVLEIEMFKAFRERKRLRIYEF